MRARSPTIDRALLERTRIRTNKTEAFLFHTEQIDVEEANNLANAIMKNLPETVTIKYITFYNCTISDKAIDILALYFGLSNSLTSLTFRGTNLTLEGIKALMGVLLLNTTLRMVDFGDCDIDDKGANEILKILEVNETVLEVALDKNKISKKIIRKKDAFLARNRKLGLATLQERAGIRSVYKENLYHDDYPYLKNNDVESVEGLFGDETPNREARISEILKEVDKKMAANGPTVTSIHNTGSVVEKMESFDKRKVFHFSFLNTPLTIFEIIYYCCPTIRRIALDVSVSFSNLDLNNCFDPVKIKKDENVERTRVALDGLKESRSIKYALINIASIFYSFQTGSQQKSINQLQLVFNIVELVFSFLSETRSQKQEDVAKLFLFMCELYQINLMPFTVRKADMKKFTNLFNNLSDLTDYLVGCSTDGRAIELLAIKKYINDTYLRGVVSDYAISVESQQMNRDPIASQCIRVVLSEGQKSAATSLVVSEAGGQNLALPVLSQSSESSQELPKRSFFEIKRSFLEIWNKLVNRFSKYGLSLFLTDRDLVPVDEYSNDIKMLRMYHDEFKDLDFDDKVRKNIKRRYLSHGYYGDFSQYRLVNISLLEIFCNSSSDDLKNIPVGYSLKEEISDTDMETYESIFSASYFTDFYDDYSIAIDPLRTRINDILEHLIIYDCYLCGSGISFKYQLISLSQLLILNIFYINQNKSFYQDSPFSLNIMKSLIDLFSHWVGVFVVNRMKEFSDLKPSSYLQFEKGYPYRFKDIFVQNPVLSRDELSDDDADRYIEDFFDNLIVFGVKVDDTAILDESKKTALALKNNLLKILRDEDKEENKEEDRRLAKNSVEGSVEGDTLNIPYCQFNDAGLEFVLDFIAQNADLRRLIINDSTINEKGLRLLSDALRKSKINSVNLDSSWGVGLGGFFYFLESLNDPDNLITELSFWCCYIGNETVKVIGDVLSKNKKLKKIVFSQMFTVSEVRLGIDDEGAEYLARGLEKNDVLEEFSLECSNIGENGARELSNALVKNATLRSFKIYFLYNVSGDISDDRLEEIVGYLAGAIEKNEGLTEFVIHNALTEKAALILINALSKNFKIQKFTLNGNDPKSSAPTKIDPNIFLRIEEILIRNRLLAEQSARADSMPLLSPISRALPDDSAPNPAVPALPDISAVSANTTTVGENVKIKKRTFVKPKGSLTKMVSDPSVVPTLSDAGVASSSHDPPPAQNTLPFPEVDSVVLPPVLKKKIKKKDGKKKVEDRVPPLPLTAPELTGTGEASTLPLIAVSDTGDSISEPKRALIREGKKPFREDDADVAGPAPAALIMTPEPASASELTRTLSLSRAGGNFIRRKNSVVRTGSLRRKKKDVDETHFSLEEKRLSKGLLKRYKNEKALYALEEEIIDQHPDLVKYFRNIQFCLAKTVAGLMSVSSGHVSSSSFTKNVISLADTGVSVFTSMLTIPPIIEAIPHILTFALNGVEEHQISVLAYRVSRLFPNPSEDGTIIHILAILLTTHLKELILKAPSLNTVPFMKRGFLSLSHMFERRESLTPIDHLVMVHLKKIMKFWGSISTVPAPSISEWFPQLLAEFEIDVEVKITHRDPSLPTSSSRDYALEIIAQSVLGRVSFTGTRDVDVADAAAPAVHARGAPGDSSGRCVVS